VLAAAVAFCYCITFAEQVPEPRNRARLRTFIPSERWPDVQAALRGETPASQQTSRAVEGVRRVSIDDTPDEDGTPQSSCPRWYPPGAPPSTR
jgi:hypothetical protein